MDRKKKFCPDCNTIPYRNFNSARNLNSLNVLGGFHNNNNIHGGLRDVKERLREEANVIENCLKANNSAANRETSLFNPTGFSMYHYRNHKETPIFNPSDYVCQGYPHFRTRIHPKPQRFRCLRTGNALKYQQARGKYEYPVFEISRSESFLLHKQSAFVCSNVDKSHWWIDYQFFAISFLLFWASKCILPKTNQFCFFFFFFQIKAKFPLCFELEGKGNPFE